MLRFKCPNCQKLLGAKPEQAGKRGNCPNCKKPFVVPVPKKVPIGKPSVDADNLAADILAQSEAAEKASQPAQQIEMECPFCFEPVKFDVEMAGKQVSCPSCTRILKVDRPKKNVTQNWREAGHMGPQFTKENVENKLDDVMTTGETSTVHRESMEKAGAIPERQAEPVTVGTWIRRGFIAVAVLGVLVAGWFAAGYFGQVAKEKTTLKDAELAFDKVKDKMPRSWIAAYHRTRGEFFASKEKPDQANKDFYTARFQFPPGSPNLKPTTLEEELLLIEVALAQVELGGNEEEEIEGKKLAWPKVVDITGRTFKAIASEDGNLLGLRRVCLKLLKKNQDTIALSLAKSVSAENSQRHSLLSAQIALLLAMKNPRDAKQIKLPPDDKDAKLDLATRMGYAEGKAHEGNFQEARQIAGAPGIAVQRLKALLAVAEVALHYDSTAEAKSSLDDALALVENDPTKRYITPLSRYQFVWLIARLDSPDNAKRWADSINNPELRALAHLEIMRQKAKDDPNALHPGQITPKQSLAYALAVQMEMQRKPSQLNYFLTSYEETLHPLIFATQILPGSQY